MTHAQAKLIATFFYTGLLRPAPGTWGTLAALPAAWVLHNIAGPFALIVASALAYWIGINATKTYTSGTKNHDPSEVVIDEVVGMWIALLPVSIGAYISGIDVFQMYPGLIVAFVAFRFFDITKLGPIGTADRRADATGVMLDDVFAGIAAAFTVGLMGFLAHAIFIP